MTTPSARGSDLYFQRWDGQATTVEAFIACFAEASGRDLGAFFAWYEQAGTPTVSIDALWDESAKALDLTLRQSTAPTPGQPDKKPLPIPIAFGLLDEDGRAMRDTEVVMLRPGRAPHPGPRRRPPSGPLGRCAGFPRPWC